MEARSFGGPPLSFDPVGCLPAQKERLMKKYLPFVLMVVLAVAGTLCLTGCTSDLGFMPVTQDEMAEQMADSQEYQMRAMEEAAEGDTLSALVLFFLSAASGVAGSVGLSKQRRKNQAIGADALAAATGLKQFVATQELPKDEA